jgi:predicted metal-dependent peptidase
VFILHLMFEFNDALSKAIKLLLLKEPFYGLFLSGLNKHVGNNVPTAGVKINKLTFDLIINPDYFMSLDEFQKQGLLQHETLHICFFHLLDFDYLINRDRHKANIAFDIEINQYIDPSYLPPDGCTLEKFAHLNPLPKQGSDYYFNLIDEAEKNNDPFVKGLLEAMRQQESEYEGTRVPDHKWDVENMPEGLKQVLKNQTEGMIQEAYESSKAQGNIPGKIKEIIDKMSIKEPPKFNWKNYLRRFVGRGVKTRIKPSKMKPSKRFPDLPGIRLKYNTHVLVGIDTSGSVDTKELTAFLSEIYHMQKMGAKITLIEADTKINYIGEFNPKKDIEIHGRGGTSFDEVCEYYTENIKTYGGLIYFTDGFACPPKKPIRGKVLWVVTGQNPGLPGEVIKLDL